MKSGRITITQDEAEVFDRAVRDKALAVVTLQSGGAWHSFKCRFMERDPNRRFFVLDYESRHEGELPPLELGQYVGISFRHSSRKVMFATIVEARGKYRRSDEQQVSAVRYRWPQGMTEMQRRSFYRTPVPAEMNILAHLWPGGIARRAAAQNETLRIVTGGLADLSCGGALVCVRDSATPPWCENETLGVELELDDGRPPAQLDAHYRGSRHDSQGRSCAAIQFVGTELSVDGRLILERLSRFIQRIHRQSPPERQRNYRRER